MGRRSINTTKSGKYMNPTDQARKEARKKELKKNKKQRIAVRQAVLKSKDALQLLEEASMYDKQEYDPNIQAPLNERVLQGKRKRLLETFDSLLILYKKEDGEYAKQLQSARRDYDKRRHDMMLYYEQVKLAERTKASDIPLPDLPPSQIGQIPVDLTIPRGLSMPFSKGILKKPLGLPGPPPGAAPIGRKPPGPPPLPAPELSDSDSEDTDIQRKIRFAEFGNGIHAPGGRFPNVAPSQISLPGVNFPSYPGYPGGAGMQPHMIMHNTGAAFLSAPPSMNPHAVEAVSGEGVGGGTTIEAKPQLKSFVGDSTRFVPTSLKVRRTVRDAQGRLMHVGGGVGSASDRQMPPSSSGMATTAAQRIGRIPGGALGVSGNPTAASATNKDAAYNEFMREMEGLL